MASVHGGREIAGPMPASTSTSAATASATTAAPSNPRPGVLTSSILFILPVTPVVESGAELDVPAAGFELSLVRRSPAQQDVTGTSGGFGSSAINITHQYSMSIYRISASGRRRVFFRTPLGSIRSVEDLSRTLALSSAGTIVTRRAAATDSPPGAMAPAGVAPPSSQDDRAEPPEFKITFRTPDDVESTVHFLCDTELIPFRPSDALLLDYQPKSPYDIRGEFSSFVGYLCQLCKDLFDNRISVLSGGAVLRSDAVDPDGDQEAASAPDAPTDAAPKDPRSIVNSALNNMDSGPLFSFSSWSPLDILSFEHQLLNELEALETASIHTLVQNRHQIQQSLSLIDMSLSHASTLEGWISSLSAPLEKLSSDLAVIEERNRKLSIRNMNENRLRSVLTMLKDNLTIDPMVLRALESTSFDDPANIPTLVQASAILNQALLVDYSDALQRMECVQSNLRIFQQTYEVYSYRLDAFLSDLINKRIDSMLSTGPGPTHRSLHTYRVLVDTLLEADVPTLLSGLQDIYSTRVKRVYQRFLRFFVPLLQDRIMPDPPPDVVSQYWLGFRQSSLAAPKGAAVTAVNIVSAAADAARERVTAVSSLGSGSSSSGQGQADVVSQPTHFRSMLVNPLSQHEEVLTPINGLFRFLEIVYQYCLGERGFYAIFFKPKRRVPAEKLNPLTMFAELSEKEKKFLDMSFDNLNDSLHSLAKNALRADPTISVSFMVACEVLCKYRLVNEPFLRGMIERFSTDIILREYTDMIGASLQSIAPVCGITVRKRGMLESFQVFPNMIRRIEACFEVDLSYSQLVSPELTTEVETDCALRAAKARALLDTDYARMARRLLSSLPLFLSEPEPPPGVLHNVAAANQLLVSLGEKGQRDAAVLIAENCYHFAHEFNTLKIRCLAPYTAAANKLYKAYLDFYAVYCVTRALGRLGEFMSGVRGLLDSGRKPEEVGFVVTYSRNALVRAAGVNALSDLRKALRHTYQSLRRHFSKSAEGQLNAASHHIEMELISRITQYEQWCRSCYGGATLESLVGLSVGKVSDLIKEIGVSGF